MRGSWPLFGIGLAACGSGEPTWAIDPIFLDPDGSGVRGTHTWQVYAERWDRRFSERHYVCSAVASFRGLPAEPDCDGCLAAFEVQAELADSDCPESLASDPRFVGLRRVAVTAPGEDGPHPGATAVGFADYGGGWELHGHAWPAALSYGSEPASTSWNGVEPFALTPTLVWPLAGGGGLAPVSRVGPDPGP